MTASILAALIVLLCLLQRCSSSPNPAYSSVRCSPTAFTDPYAGAQAAVAASSSSAFYATASASSVLIYSAAIPAFNASSSTPAPVSFTSIPSPCFNYAALSLSFSPSYARCLDLQQNLLAIGSPSKDLSSSSPASFIDLVQLSLNASGGINASSSQTLYASDTAYLGLSFSLSSDAQYLAAFYTADALVIFHPVWNRSEPQYNTGADSDVMLQYPADFYADSFELHPPHLAVTGMTTSSGVAAVPTLLLYVAQSVGGVWSNWVLSSSLTLAQQLPASSAANTLPIASMSLPSNALPVSFSATASSPILVGVPALETVFMTTLPSPSLSNLYYLQNDAAVSQLAQFASDVKLSDDTDTAFVLSQQGLVTFATASLLAAACSPDNATGCAVNVLLAADSIAPNRFQYDSAVAVSYVAVAASASLTVLMPAPASLTSPFLLPATAAAVYYDNVIGQFSACPPGSYRAPSSSATASPCTFCPVNTYSPQPGSTSCLNCTAGQYCPAGSTYPFNTTVVSREPASDVPEFSSESFADSFEDLLINAIFNPDTVPVIMAVVLAGVTLLAVGCYWAFECSRPVVKPVLWLYRFALMPNEEEEKEKENEVKGILNELLEQREKQQPVYKCPHAVLIKRNSLSKHGAAAAERHDDSPYIQPTYANLPGSSPLFAHREHSSSGAEEEKQAEKEAEAGGSEHTRKLRAEQEVSEDTKLQEEIMHGFFNVLMLLFGISCVVFSWTYLNNYQPDASGESENNNRYRSEELVSVTVTDDVEVLGLSAINAVNATILTLLIGYSGIQCDSSALLGLQLEGCIIQQNNQLCNQSGFISVYESPHLPNTCTIEFQLVQGTLLALMAVMTVSLPPSLQVQALRFVFLQDAQQSYPEDFIVTGPTTFYDTAMHPTDADGNLIPNALAPRVERDWVFGILAQGEQIDEETPPSFSYVWYNTVTSLNTAWLPTAPLSEYASSQADSVQLVLTMQTETFFRLQLTQKLIEKKAAFLTILLGLIAIFHVIEFGKQVVEIALLVLKKVRKNRALKAVSELSKEATDKMGAVVKHSVENLASVSPLQLHKRVATGSSVSVEHSRRVPPGVRLAAPAEVPPINPQYGAASYQSAYPPAALAATFSLPPVSAAYPAAYPTVAAAMPSSMLPYPVPMPNQLDAGSNSRGHSRRGSRDGGAGGSAGREKFTI